MARGLISLEGIRLSGVPPLKECFVALRPGVTVLYGRNGSGKSRALAGLIAAFRGRARHGSSELYIRSLPPSKFGPAPTFVTPVDDIWTEIANHVHERAIELRAPADLAEYYDDLDLPDAQRLLALTLALHMGARESKELSALAEVAQQGRFVLTSTARGLSLDIGGLPDEDSPCLSDIHNDAIAFLKEPVENAHGSPPYEGPGYVYLNTTGQMRWSICDGMLSALRIAQGRDPGPFWCSDKFMTIIEDPQFWSPEIFIEEPVDLLGLTLDALGEIRTEVVRQQHPDWVDELEQLETVTPSSMSQTAIGPLPLEQLRRALSAKTDEIEAAEAAAFERRQWLKGALRVSPGELLVIEENGSVRISSGVSEAIAKLAALANELLALLLSDAPSLQLIVRPVTSWVTEPAIHWTAHDPTGATVALDELSTAQRRWSLVAVRLALASGSGRQHSVLILDEPELALHRRAERHLAEGLIEVARRFGITVILATHSPALLRHPETTLLRVRRDSTGWSSIATLPRDFRANVDDLGLNIADLLQFCQTLLLVEGEHDRIVFQTLFGEQFAANGVEIVAARGASKLATIADAQLLFNFTDARVVAMVDNEDADRMAEIWRTALVAARDGRDYMKALKEMRRARNTAESQFLQEFCTAALKSGVSERVEVTALARADIIEYLPCEMLVPGTYTWDDLRDRHNRSAAGMDFKSWLARDFDAGFELEDIERAANSVDSVDLELSRVAALCINGPS